MKIISIRQPWAALIVSGIKDVENRTWPTRYRGQLLIHASRTRRHQHRRHWASLWRSTTARVAARRHRWRYGDRQLRSAAFEHMVRTWLLQLCSRELSVIAIRAVEGRAVASRRTGRAA